MAMDFASIVSAEYGDAMLAAGTPEMLNQAPIGTGPFTFVAYQKDAVIRYAANPDYWQGPPALDNLIFAITPDASVRYQKLQAGECHVMPYPNPADVQAMKDDESIVVMEQEGLNVGYLAYNTTIPPYDNPNVRKALNMAIDKQAIIDVVFQGSGQIAKNPIPPTMWSYNDAIVDDPYDPEAAKAMLEAEGVTDLSMKIWAMPVQRPYNPNARRMAELMQEDFAKIGVDVEIVSYEWGEYLSRSSRARPRRCGSARLDRRQRRSGQLPRRAARLRRRGQLQPRAMVPRALRGADPEGQDHLRPGRAHRPLRRGAGHLQGAGALGHHRAFGGLHADAPRSAGLQGASARRPHLQRCEPRRMTLPGRGLAVPAGPPFPDGRMLPMSDRYTPFRQIARDLGIDAVALVPGPNFVRLFGQDFHEPRTPARRGDPRRAARPPPSCPTSNCAPST